MDSVPLPRVSPGRLGELGPINWVVWQVLSRASGTDDAHLFSTLGRTGGLFRGWLHFSGKLMPGGRLPRAEAELVILRVAHLRECGYETDHHRRLGRKAGLSAVEIERVAAGPDAEGWTPRQRALLAAVDQLVTTRNVDDAAWAELAAHFDERVLIEIVLLINQYEGLASTITTLRVERDTFK
ncbi:carboxymuconolactone decarboxylase family protein [Nocardia sp. NPDC058640]|uniref:carboxymuconolactone decarboxylase family protein n=1 Tax=Nocardia sp. NPDC058640 TaxID=3346571 RepID=UPI00366205CF